MIYGAWPQDYEASSHVWGGKLNYTNQIDAANLVSASVSIDTQHILTANFTNYDPNTVGGIAFDYVDSSGQCHNPKSGAYASCFAGSRAFYQLPVPDGIAGVAAAFPTAGAPGAQWLVTEDGQYGSLDTVNPTWTTASVGDHLQPSDKWTIDVGARWEEFSYALADTAGGPARAFWFAAWNRENCYIPGMTSVMQLGIDPTTGHPIDPATGKPFDCAQHGGVPLVNTNPGSASYFAFEPRIAATYEIDGNTVLRASAGRYAEGPGSTDQQFNYVQQDLPSQLAQFLPYGYNTPYHDERPEYSSGYDFSLEKRISGTDYSFKVTPYYRQTYDQLQLTPVGPQGLFAAFNTDSQTNYGLELLLRKGDFARDGFSFQFGYTLNESRVRYNDLGTSAQNAIDVQNAYIQQYNSYTGHCGTATGPNSLCGAYGTTYSHPAFPALNGSAVTNPYFGQPAQPLFARNGWYTPYDVLPSPFSGASGYNVPTNLSLILNYKRGRWTFTPTATFVAGGKYGSPLTWPGYDPALCLAPPKPARVACGQLLIPDAYTGKFDAQGAFVVPCGLRSTLRSRTRRAAGSTRRWAHSPSWTSVSSADTRGTIRTHANTGSCRRIILRPWETSRRLRPPRSSCATRTPCSATPPTTATSRPRCRSRPSSTLTSSSRNNEEKMPRPFPHLSLALLSLLFGCAAAASTSQAPAPIVLAKVKPSQAFSGPYSYLVPPYSDYYFHNMDTLGFRQDWVRRYGPAFALREPSGPFEASYTYRRHRYTLDQYYSRNRVLAFLVLKDDRIVSERYFHGSTADSRFLSNSVQKSFTSTLFGIAVQDGKISSVDDPVTKYLPWLDKSGYNRVTLRQALEMATGIGATENYLDPHSSVQNLAKSMLRGVPSFSNLLLSLPANRKVNRNRLRLRERQHRSARSRSRKSDGYAVERVHAGEALEQARRAKRRVHRARPGSARPVRLRLFERDAARLRPFRTDDDERRGARRERDRRVAVGARSDHAEKKFAAQPDGPHDEANYGYAYQWWIPYGKDGTYEALGVYGQILYVNPAKHVVMWRSPGRSRIPTNAGTSR